MRVALIYVRQSRHRDYERTISPQVQEKACRELPAVAACETIEVYTDLDTSGKSVAKRPEFQKFLQRLQDDPPAVIAAYSQSRSFRNTSEALEFFAMMERLPQVNVQVAHGHFDRSAAGELSYTAIAAADTFQRRMTADNMRDTYRFKAEDGQLVGQVPAGYIRQADGKGFRRSGTPPSVSSSCELRLVGLQSANGANPLRLCQDAALHLR